MTRKPSHTKTALMALQAMMRHAGGDRRQSPKLRPVDTALQKILARTKVRRLRFVPHKNINGVVVKNYCETARVAVEVEYTAAADHPMRRVEDADRSGYLNAMGIKLIQIPEQIILERPESVRNTLIEELGE